MTPLSHPTTHPQDYWGGDTKRGEGGLIKVKEQAVFKIYFRWFKAFIKTVFFLIMDAGWLGPDS